MLQREYTHDGVGESVLFFGISKGVLRTRTELSIVKYQITDTACEPLGD